MGIVVVAGAMCVCTFGSAPCALKVTSQSKWLAEGKPVATIQDIQPVANLATFGMCSSLANPTVAAATAAALGVLTPQPCTLLPQGPWSPASKVLAGGKPCLTNEASLVCAFGHGMIQITMPGQSKVLV